jgi:hypothetical protein
MIISRILIAYLAWVALVSSAAAVEITFDVDDSSPEEAAILAGFAEELEAALPQGAREILARPVRIRFAALDSMAELENVCPADREKGGELHVFGDYQLSSTGAHEFRLHQGFRSEIAKGPAASRAIDCGHRTLYRMALGTVVHEIGHVLDSSKDFSGSRQYQSLMDWSSGWFGKAPKNTLETRSPDPYEFHSPAEGFAVNLEYFVLDPEFSCRRPAVARYLSDRLGSPRAPSDCAPFRKVFLSPQGPWVDLDPARIAEVHYLFAAKGQQLMSRWGHASFRLVLCDPDRAEVGPGCRRDTSRHVVVGYRANVLDTNISYWKGLMGGYASNIFFFNFSDIVREYTELGLRDLISLPMALSPAERELFVSHVLEQYWGYSGRYAFFSNNCATEARGAVRGAVDQRHDFQERSSLSPLGLYDDLAEAGLIDLGLLEPRDAAIREGYFFPSSRKDLEFAFAQVKERLDREGKFSHESLDCFFDRSNAVERAGYLRPSEPQHIASLYVLEKHMVNVLDKRVVAKAIAAVNTAEVPLESFRTQADQFRQMLAQLKPWNQIGGLGYGLPLLGEVSEEKIEVLVRALVATFQGAVSVFESAMPGLFVELRAAEKNLREFGKMLWPGEPAIVKENVEVL